MFYVIRVPVSFKFKAVFAFTVLYKYPLVRFNAFPYYLFRRTARRKRKARIQVARITDNWKSFWPLSTLPPPLFNNLACYCLPVYPNKGVVKWQNSQIWQTFKKHIKKPANLGTLLAMLWKRRWKMKANKKPLIITAVKKLFKKFLWQSFQTRLI